LNPGKGGGTGDEEKVRSQKPEFRSEKTTTLRLRIAPSPGYVSRDDPQEGGRVSYF
jgi:hypothetical protein